MEQYKLKFRYFGWRRRNNMLQSKNSRDYNIIKMFVWGCRNAWMKERTLITFVGWCKFVPIHSHLIFVKKWDLFNRCFVMGNFLSLSLLMVPHKNSILNVLSWMLVDARWVWYWCSSFTNSIFLEYDVRGKNWNSVGVQFN